VAGFYSTRNRIVIDIVVTFPTVSVSVKNTIEVDAQCVLHRFLAIEPFQFVGFFVGPFGPAAAPPPVSSTELNDDIEPEKTDTPEPTPEPAPSIPPDAPDPEPSPIDEPEEREEVEAREADAQAQASNAEGEAAAEAEQAANSGTSKPDPF